MKTTTNPLNTPSQKTGVSHNKAMDTDELPRSVKKVLDGTQHNYSALCTHLTMAYNQITQESSQTEIEALIVLRKYLEEAIEKQFPEASSRPELMLNKAIKIALFEPRKNLLSINPYDLLKGYTAISGTQILSVLILDQLVIAQLHNEAQHIASDHPDKTALHEIIALKTHNNACMQNGKVDQIKDDPMMAWNLVDHDIPFVQLENFFQPTTEPTEPSAKRAA